MTDPVFEITKAAAFDAAHRLPAGGPEGRHRAGSRAGGVSGRGRHRRGGNRAWTGQHEILIGEEVLGLGIRLRSADVQKAAVAAEAADA